jgi:hypothetical protein
MSGKRYILHFCKIIARDEQLPFVRMGFPITDRPGHNYFTNVALHILPSKFSTLSSTIMTEPVRKNGTSSAGDAPFIPSMAHSHRLWRPDSPASSELEYNKEVTPQ